MTKNKFDYGDKVIVVHVGDDERSCRFFGLIGMVSALGCERECWFYNIEFDDGYATFSEYSLKLHNGIERNYEREYKSET
jgi:hypothetical protein